jgi:tRNA (cmo5U34)-methyltransferase
VRGLENLYQTLGAKVASACRTHSRVLIVGGGGGREIEFLARHEIAASLTIVDPSRGNLSDARSLAQDVGYLGAIKFVEGTVDCLPESPKFDAATIIFVLHSIHDATTEVRLLQSASSRMTANGTLFLADRCFSSDGSVEDLLMNYETHAKGLETARDLIDLEVNSVLERRDRTELLLAKKLGSADLAITSHITRAAWYAAFSVKRV